MIKRVEENDSNFKGTIIDIETIGKFNRLYKYDSRQYGEMIQFILGYINKEHIHIYCAEDMSEVRQLNDVTKSIIESLSRPFYAFNCEFESGVWFHRIGITIHFDGELNKEKYEPKKDAVRVLGIPNYDDPFFDDGYKCIQAWEKGALDEAILHNRACLLKERDILLKRGYREPDELEFIK